MIHKTTYRFPKYEEDLEFNSGNNVSLGYKFYLYKHYISRNIIFTGVSSIEKRHKTSHLGEICLDINCTLVVGIANR